MLFCFDFVLAFLTKICQMKILSQFSQRCMSSFLLTITNLKKAFKNTFDISKLGPSDHHGVNTIKNIKPEFPQSVKIVLGEPL